MFLGPRRRQPRQTISDKALAATPTAETAQEVDSRKRVLMVIDTT